MPSIVRRKTGFYEDLGCLLSFDNGLVESGQCVSIFLFDWVLPFQGITLQDFS